MVIPLILGAALCIGLFGFTKHLEKKQKKAHDEGISRLKPGVRIQTIGGIIGTVTEVTSNSIKADFSPDGSGSVIEVTKDAFYSIVE